MADRDGIFRLGLKMVFAVEDDLRVVAEAAKADEVLARAETFQPDSVFIQEEILVESDGKPHLRRDQCSSAMSGHYHCYPLIR